MSDLACDGCAFGMDGIGELREAADGFFSHVETFGVRAAFGRHCQVGDCGHPHAACCDLAVIFNQLWRDESIGHDAFKCGRLDDAVAQGDRAELRRGEWVYGLSGCAVSA